MTTRVVSTRFDKPKPREDKKKAKNGDENGEVDDDSSSGLKAFIVYHLDKFFVEHIPVDSVKELNSSTYLYAFGIVAYLVMFLYFIYFTYTSYQGAISQAYISLDDNGALCNTVQIAVTGDYLADSNGNWVGSPAFVYAFGKYSVSLNNFEATPQQYSEMMNFFYEILVDLGKQGQSENLPYNLVRWASFIRYYSIQNPLLTNFTTVGYGQLQYLQLSGNPQDIYQLNFQQIVLGSPYGYCPITGFTSYDYANGLITTSVNFTTFTNNEVCGSCVIPNSFGYSDQLDQNIFEISIEVRAFMTSFAVNSGILDITSLARSGDLSYNFVFNNITYTAGEYFDTRYAEMKPIFCMYNTSYAPPGYFQSICFYSVSATIALPVFNHFGTSYSQPVYCSCSNENGHSESCNYFNLLSGLIYYPIPLNPQDITKSLQTQIGYLLLLASQYSSYYDLNRAAYNASWGAAAVAYGKKSPSTTTPSYYRNSFQFCNIKGTFCSLAVAHSNDRSNQLVSLYKYQLANGSCVDSFTIPEDLWANLAKDPPVQLTQNYYECYNDAFTAFFNAIGIASGNVQLAVPLTVVFLLPLVYAVLVAIKQTPPKEEYNNREKQQALEILSILLLRLRDGKSRGVKKNGVLMQLTSELIKAAMEESGYPDSDDDENDSDDEGGEEDDDDDNETENNTNQNQNQNNNGFNGKVSNDNKDSRRKSTRSNGGNRVVTLDSDDEEDAVRESMGNSNPSPMGSPARQARKKSQRKSRKSVRPSLAQLQQTSAQVPLKRSKMGVFTKQLEEKNNDKAMKRKSTAPSADMRASESSSNFFGYFMGSGTTTKKNEGMTGEQEMIPIGNPVLQSVSSEFPRIDLSNPPNDIQIMNLTNRPISAKVISGEAITILIDDLVHSFTEAINSRPNDPALLTKSSMSIALETEEYKRGSLLALQLAHVNFQEFVATDDPTMFFKLSNALSMHASLELRCEMRQIEMLYADRIGYNVGGRLMTASSLMKLL